VEFVFDPMKCTTVDPDASDPLHGDADDEPVPAPRRAAFFFERHLASPTISIDPRPPVVRPRAIDR
jgi:hypothetical protein